MEKKTINQVLAEKEMSKVCTENQPESYNGYISAVSSLISATNDKMEIEKLKISIAELKGRVDVLEKVITRSE
jgi:hypothetical protein